MPLNPQHCLRLLGAFAVTTSAAAALAPAAHAAVPAAPTLSLLDATTDKTIDPLKSGDVLNLATLPSRKLSVKAVPSLSVGSVGFTLDGAVVRTENLAPYSIAGDNGSSDFYAWTPKVGKHTLKVTSYSNANRAGTASATATIAFTVVDIPMTAPKVALMNAATDKAIADFNPIDSGDTLNLAKLPTRKLNIKVKDATVTGGKSFTFTLDGTKVRTESAAPFAIAGDDGKGDYYAWTPKVGKHVLKVTPYGGTAATGTVGPTATVSFTVTDTTATAPVVTTTTPTATTPPQPPVETTPPPVETTPQPPVETTPEPTPVPSTSFADLLKSDMTKSSEVLPDFGGVDWAYAARSGQSTPLAGFTSFAAWGVLSTAKDGNPQPGARVELKDVTAWFFSKSQGKWIKATASQAFLGGAFYKSDWSNQTKPADKVLTSNNSTSVGNIPSGYSFHYYPDRGTIPMNWADVGGVVITIRARLQPGTYDEAATAPAYTMCAALDWWKSPSAPWLSDYSNNRDAGIGRFKAVQKDWRVFSMSNGNLSTLPPVPVDASELR